MTVPALESNLGGVFQVFRSTEFEVSGGRRNCAEIEKFFVDDGGKTKSEVKFQNP